ncbi:uncharacterized protein LOC115445972 [Manduca sexta]|uniref:uncharacterized protein LOC115445972 n=1 Tax=Manduca sexta TaxID=7130 RepID=UPI001181EB85|nr:uncharacterized protein LOC115445972 [Manduca sexta]
MRYYIIALVVLSVAAYVQLRPSCSTCNRSNILDTAIAKMVAIDTEIYTVLKLFKTYVPKEKVGKDSYKLEYYLPQFSGNFEVRIKHRLLGVIGHDPKVNECDYTYVDMRILPDFVDTHEGVWQFSGGHLTIEWPYAYNLEESEGGCSSSIDDTLIILRRVY